MFKKVKAKFILISMLAITFVILLIVGTTNAVNYFQMNHDNDEIITYIMNERLNNPSLSPDDTTNQGNNNPGMYGNNPIDFGNHFGPESSYNIRYFIVNKVAEGYIYDLSSIASVSEEEAAEYADEALKGNSLSGYIGSYRYNIDSTRHMVVFLLCDDDLGACLDFLMYSLIFSGIGLVVSFIFIFVFSDMILKPVRDGYEKQKQFITNASHELKTPLTIISANNELLELTQGENQYTETISKQVKRMTSMTRSLTALSRLGENPEIVKEEVNVSELLWQMGDTFAPLFEQNNKKLILDIQDNVIIITSNEFLTQLVSIFLDNANKYTLSVATLSLKSGNGLVTITQTNDTENITEGDLSYFTDRFYRDDSIRNKVAGSGIGLSIAKEITEALHGKMKIYGKDGHFCISIELR